MKKEGAFIEKENNTHRKSADSTNNPQTGEDPRQIYDKIFKRIFSLSNTAVIHLINGLFDRHFPPDSSVKYPNREFVIPSLKNRPADVILIINNVHVFHLEAQMTKDEMIVLRVFEYGFQHALSMQSAPDRLDFPEPAVIYLDKSHGIPEESILHISFGTQGSFDYHVKNYLYLAHDAEELDRKKMAVLIPFQVLRLRSLLAQWKRLEKNGKTFDIQEFYQLQEKIKDDIISSIRQNLELGNITYDDSRQLFELTNRLYEHIYKDFVLLGGEDDMNPLLPGALELPNDKYRFRIHELEKEIERYADENARFADEITRYADENSRFADENARYADENAKLKKRIAELEGKIMS